jgi:5-hydroxyisourate hydrolase
VSLSTHVLDTSKGRPVRGLSVRLEQVLGGQAVELKHAVTDDDGRVKPLLAVLPSAGVYRLRFEVAPYFAAEGVAAFYQSVVIEFVVTAADEHHHVPLLLNPFGYSTYRGS